MRLIANCRGLMQKGSDLRHSQFERGRKILKAPNARQKYLLHILNKTMQRRQPVFPGRWVDQPGLQDSLVIGHRGARPVFPKQKLRFAALDSSWRDKPRRAEFVTHLKVSRKSLLARSAKGGQALRRRIDLGVDPRPRLDLG